VREERIKVILKVCGALFLILFSLLPFLWMIIISFTKHPDFLLADAHYEFTLDNYKLVLGSTSVHLIDYLKNSVVISGFAAIFATFFASLSAYAITRLTFPGKILISLIMLAFSMFPQVSIVGYLFKMMTNLGLINTYSGLIFLYIALGMPLALWIMLSYFSQLSPELDKAALIDGASRFQIFRSIIMPIAVPGIFSTMLLIFIYSFNEFLFALMLTIDYKARTIPVGIALFEGLHGQIPWGEIMASAVIATIPMMILAIFFQRHLIQGLTQGALKG
jgi:multiple sugar transport system permease protein